MRHAAAMFLFLAATAFQDGADPDALAERLGSERVEERADAERQLRALGTRALPALRKRIGDPDPEVARRARALSDCLEALELLGPRALREIPLAPTLLARGDDAGWTEVFLAACEQPVGPAALEALAPRAVRGARRPPYEPDDSAARLWRLLEETPQHDERRSVAVGVAGHGIRSAIPELERWLSDRDPLARQYAALALGHLRAERALPKLLALLRDPDNTTRADAATALGALGSKAAIPALARALTDECDSVGVEARVALSDLDRDEAVAEIRRLFSREEVPRQGQLVEALRRLRDEEEVLSFYWLSCRNLEQVELVVAEVLTDLDRPDAAARLVPLLEDPRPEIRQDAVKTLQDLGARETIGAILPLLRDPVPGVRAEAAQAAGAFDGRQDLPALLALLDDPDKLVRREARLALGKLGVHEALPKMLEALRDPEAEVRRYALYALGHLAAPGAAEALVRALDDPDQESRRAALSALWKSAPVEGLPDIIRFLGEEEGVSWYPGSAGPELRARLLPGLRCGLGACDPRVRKGAIRVASDLRVREISRDLLPLLEDPDPEVRALAVRTLAWLEPRETALALVGRIWDESKEVRSAACWKLKDLVVGPDAVPELLRFLDERGYDSSAAEALVDLGAREAVPRFVRFLKDADAVVRRESLKALRRLKARDAAAPISKLLDDPEASVRAEAAEVLGSLGVASSAAELRKRLRDDDPQVRVAAVDALGGLGATEGVEALLGDGEACVRAAVVRALPDGVPVEKLLEDPDGAVRDAAARALGRRGDAKAVPALLTLLRRANGGGAAEALGVLGAREAVPELLRILADGLATGYPSADVVGALRRLAPKEAAAAAVRFLERGSRPPFRSGRALSELVEKGIVRRWGCCMLAERPLPRASAVGMLADLGAAEALPVLRRHLADRNPRVRSTAALSLMRLADPSMEPDVARLLRHENHQVRAQAAELLTRWGARDALPELRRLLHSPRGDFTEAAVAACARLGGRDGVPDLVPLLQEDDLRVRVQAASWLCRLGREEGRRILLEEGRGLFSLNAVRAPELWRRLESTPLPGELRGTGRDLLERVARLADLEAEIPEVLPYAVDSDLSRERTIDPGRGRTLLDALDELLDGAERPCLILEADRLRLLPRGEAWGFWSDWDRSR